MKRKILTMLLILVTCTSYIFATDNLNINSKTAVAIDADSSVVLYNKDMNKKIYPASTTKILTAILAIENVDLQKSVVVSKTAIKIPWDSSSVYLKEGEVITIEDLLYCLLLNSGNDAANVLAEAISGDIDSFVKLMNQKAKEIGCTNTNFNNAHGYSDDNHYTTALDMAKILSYCIKNDTFVKISSTKSYIVEETNKTKEKRYLYNTNRLILTKEDSVYARYYEYCIGGKTGYTDESGRTLVAYGKKDNKYVVVTIFGASAKGSEDVRYTDAINLFEYSFNNFDKKTIAKAEDYNFNYINIDKKLNYNVGLNQNFEMLSKTDSNYDVSYTINIDETNFKDMDETNFKEVSAGTINFIIKSPDGNTYEAIKTLYLKNIQKYNIVSNTNIFMIVLIICLIIVFVLSLAVILTSRKKIQKAKTSRKSRRTK